MILPPLPLNLSGGMVEVAQGVTIRVIACRRGHLGYQARADPRPNPRPCLPSAIRTRFAKISLWTVRMTPAWRDSLA